MFRVKLCAVLAGLRVFFWDMFGSCWGSGFGHTLPEVVSGF